MITFAFIQFVKRLSESSTIRSVFVWGLLLLSLWLLFRSIVSIIHKSKKKILLTLAGVSLLVELICCVLFLFPTKAVELEYVGKFDIRYDMHTDESIAWDILTGINDTQTIEVFLPPEELDLKPLALDTEQYSYLLVYGSERVSLSYSFWDLEFNNVIPATKAFFWGHLSSNGEIEPGKVYVFRFKRPIFPIVRYGIF